MTILWSNNASTTVAGSITTVSTTVALASGTGVLFPHPTGSDYFVATFYDQATKTQFEIVHVTAVVGDVATIVRAQEGTTAKNWNAGDLFANLVTAGTLANFVQSGVGPADTSYNYVGHDVSTTPNLLIANTVPVPVNYAEGMEFHIWVANQNTGPMQAQLNGKAAVAVTRLDGSAIVPGTIPAGIELVFFYNGVNFNTQIPPVPQAPPQTVFYVRPDGNDNNSGFANTAAAAFLTISGAIHMIKQRYISQSAITIRVADGFYVDVIADNSNYIATWIIIGNTANPGTVVINATPTTVAGYPPYVNVVYGVCAFADRQATIQVSGFTFQALDGCVGADKGATLLVENCNFTAPVHGGSPIFSTSGGNVILAGNCQYSGATPATAIFAANGAGNIVLGTADPPFGSFPLVFNIAGTPVITSATAFANAGGIIEASGVLSFTGGVPACEQYNCSTGGGIMFAGGVTTVFPGTLPGVVTPPGWTA